MLNEVDYMPRPRKYDYDKDYPVKKVLYVKLPIVVASALEEKFSNPELSKLVEKFLVDYAQKDID